MHGHWPRSACLPVLHFAPWKGQVYSCPLCVRLGGSWADCSLLTGTSYLSTGDRTSGLALLLAAERANLSLFLSPLLSAASCAHSLYKPRFSGSASSTQPMHMGMGEGGEQRGPQHAQGGTPRLPGVGPHDTVFVGSRHMKQGPYAPELGRTAPTKFTRMSADCLLEASRACYGIC